MSSYEIIYVEGTDDQEILNLLFPSKGNFEPKGNKKKVTRAVEKGNNCCGIVDRDFDSDEEVSRSRLSTSRCAILSRYSMENYLLEPKYLWKFAESIQITEHQDWKSVASIEQLLIRKGQELSHYSAANGMLIELARNINFQQLTPYFNDYPIIEKEAVCAELRQRFEILPAREELERFLAEWEEKASSIHAACSTLEGVNRWINGKVLLRDVLYGEIIASIPTPPRKFTKKNFVQRLAQIAKNDLPTDLKDILKGFGIEIAGVQLNE